MKYFFSKAEQVPLSFLPPAQREHIFCQGHHRTQAGSQLFPLSHDMSGYFWPWVNIRDMIQALRERVTGSKAHTVVRRDSRGCKEGAAGWGKNSLFSERFPCSWKWQQAPRKAGGRSGPEGPPRTPGSMGLIFLLHFQTS